MKKTTIFVALIATLILAISLYFWAAPRSDETNTEATIKAKKYMLNPS